jgi:hypothetical protein
MKTIKVNWTQYHKLVHKLALYIKKSGKVYKAVYSPDNPMLAFLLSKELEIKLIDSLVLYLYTDGRETKQSEVLIDSDIINTGKTREQYKDFDFACLYMRTYHEYAGSKRKTFYVNFLDDCNTQVILPWEKEIK